MSVGWGSSMVRLAYRGAGWSDPGEEQAISSLLPLPPGSRILDIGIGGGRTTSFLEHAGASYEGIDVTPEMVDDAHRRYPDANLHVGDAAHLEQLPSSSYELIVFSLNGIDCLDHAERERFLRECVRLLTPGGALQFSTHNLEGPSFREQPSWQDARERLTKPGVAAKAEAVIGGVPRLLLAKRNMKKHAALQPQGDGWAMAPLRAHEFRFVCHFATLAEVKASLARAGLLVEAMWTNTGTRLPLDAVTHSDAFVQIVCRRAPVVIDLVEQREPSETTGAQD